MSGSESMIRSNPSVSDEAFILTEEVRVVVSRDSLLICSD